MITYIQKELSRLINHAAREQQEVERPCDVLLLVVTPCKGRHANLEGEQVLYSKRVLPIFVCKGVEVVRLVVKGEFAA